MNLPLRRITFWGALLGLASLVLFVRANSEVPPIPPPLVAPPEKPFVATIAASGLVEALRENTHIGVPVSGVVTEVNVMVWQKVHKNDVLLRLDDRELRAQLHTQRAELAVRETELQRARRMRDRLVRILASNAVAAQDAETSEDEYRIAQAQVAKAEASLAQTEELLERFVVRAPIDATVLQVNIRAGESATVGAAIAPVVLGTIHDLQIRADVDEQIASRVREGAPAVAFRKGETENPIPLTFVRIEPYIVPKKSLTGSSLERVDTRVLQVIYRFKNEGDVPTYVGQQVDVFIGES